MQLGADAILAAGVIGAAAGLIGGLAGIGGSLVMLPGLALALGYTGAAEAEQHLYIAAAMCVNVLVAASASRLHLKRQAVDWGVVRWLLPSLGGALVLGVLASNSVEGRVLRHMLAGAIAAYCLWNIVLAVRGQPDVEPLPKARVGAAVATGVAAGGLGGMLGLGGGVIMVPGLQILARVPLRRAVASSAIAMVPTSAVGATIKLVTLDQHDQVWTEALVLAAAMGVPAILLAPVGAGLTHRLPIGTVRLAISAVLLVSAAKLAGLF